MKAVDRSSTARLQVLHVRPRGGSARRSRAHRRPLATIRIPCTGRDAEPDLRVNRAIGQRAWREPTPEELAQRTGVRPRRSGSSSKSSRKPLSLETPIARNRSSAISSRTVGGVAKTNAVEPGLSTQVERALAMIVSGRRGDPPSGCIGEVRRAHAGGGRKRFAVTRSAFARSRPGVAQARHPLRGRNLKLRRKFRNVGARHGPRAVETAPGSRDRRAAGVWAMSAPPV